MTRVLVLTGPTGVGKTRVAAAVAERAAIEIVSADSCQLYKYLNIGTAKPTPEERAAVPYHGLDLVTPAERYSAGRFAREARGWIADISARGRMPVVVGGTGFYLRALFEGLFSEPGLDASRRAKLRAALAALAERVGKGEVARWAARLDAGFGRAHDTAAGAAAGPMGAEQPHRTVSRAAVSGTGGLQRAARAVEVALLTGRPLSAWQREAPPPASGLEPWYAVLALPRAQLAERIADRAAAMVAHGLVDEVRRLLAAGVPKDAPGLDAVGYREVVAMLDGRLPEAGLADAIAASTRRYAKRQETWFRGQLRGSVTWLDASRDSGALADDVLSGYRAAG